VAPAEWATVDLAVSAGHRMNTDWWAHTCPQTYARYSDACALQFGRLRSRRLRYAAHLLWVPALLGRSTTVDRRGRT
jgi:hypothetical protein